MLPLPGVRLSLHNAPLRGKPAAMKALAVLLYGMGFGAIGRLLGVSDEAASLPEPKVAAASVTLAVLELSDT